MTRNRLSRIIRAHPKRLLVALPALLAVAALAVVAGQVIQPEPAQAVPPNIITCTGTGEGETVPAITTAPLNVDVHNKGPITLTCSTVGLAGITSATFAFDGTVLLAVCESVTEPLVGSLYVGAEAAGIFNAKWNHGQAGETTFNWVVAGATQVGPGVSVVAVTGIAATGRFVPSTVNALLSVSVPPDSCSSGNDTFVSDVTYVMTAP